MNLRYCFCRTLDAWLQYFLRFDSFAGFLHLSINNGPVVLSGIAQQASTNEAAFIMEFVSLDELQNALFCPG